MTDIKKTLKAEEGFRDYAYQDHLGYWTIGYGRLIDKRKGGGITEDEADVLLENDINHKDIELHKSLPWLKDEHQNIQDALLLMSFQMGVKTLLSFKNTIKLIRQKKYKEAADNAMQSLWARQTPARAKRVTDLIRSTPNREKNNVS
jgi:lysozyme